MHKNSAKNAAKKIN